MVLWLLAGFFVTVPLAISVYVLVGIFGIIDGFSAPLVARVLGQPVPGIGILITALVVLAAGAVATNVIGRRLLARAESWLMMIPVFRTIYSPVKQLVAAFSPENEVGFKRVVMVEDEHRGWVMGFLTKEFTATTTPADPGRPSAGSPTVAVGLNFSALMRCLHLVHGESLIYH